MGWNDHVARIVARTCLQHRRIPDTDGLCEIAPTDERRQRARRFGGGSNAVDIVCAAADECACRQVVEIATRGFAQEISTRDQRRQHVTQTKRSRKHDAQREECEPQLTKPTGAKENDRCETAQHRHEQIGAQRDDVIDAQKQAISSAAVAQQVERIESVAPREENKHDRAQRTEMPPHMRRRSDAATFEPQASRQCIEHHHHGADCNDADQRPDVHRLLKREPVYVEPEIAIEKSFDLAKRDSVSRHRHIGPVGQRCGEAESDQARQDDGDRQQAAPGDHGRQLDVRDPRWDCDGKNGSSHGVQIGKREERSRQPCPTLKQHGIGCALPPECGNAHRGEPCVFHDKRRDCAAE